MNYIRNVTFQVKPGMQDQFSKVFVAEILPVMKKQPGFRHDLAMHNELSVMNLSVWQDKPSADKFQDTAYPELLKKLSDVIVGTPRVEAFQLATTTLPV